MFVRKESQIRHSEGKTVANKLLTVLLIQGTGGLGIACPWVAVMLSESPLLLKTNLPNAGDGYGCSQYSGHAHLGAIVRQSSGGAMDKRRLFDDRRNIFRTH